MSYYIVVGGYAWTCGKWNFGLNSHFHTFLSLCNYMHFLTLTYFNYLVWVSSFKTYSIKNQKNTLRRSFQLWFCYLINYQKKLTPLFVINPFLISSQQALIIAFACNAKNFAIAILFFFSFPWSLLLDRPPKVFL